MGSWKILLTDGLQPAGKEILTGEAVVIDRNGISAEELMAEIDDYDAVIVRGRTKITAEVIKRAKKIKVVGRCGVGVDNIDLSSAKAGGIKVVNAPEATTISVAELTMGLMYALAREIPRADAGMKNGEWLKKDLTGVELNQKSLGIIGYGRIGKRVARMAASIGMKIVVLDRFHISSSSKFSPYGYPMLVVTICP